MSYASADDLLVAPVQEDVTLMSGMVVKVRGLNRMEFLALAEADSGLAIEAATIAAGLVEPTLTLEQVKAWQETAPTGDLERVGNAIVRLSRGGKGAAKAAYKSAHGESGD